MSEPVRSCPVMRKMSGESCEPGSRHGDSAIGDMRRPQTEQVSAKTAGELKFQMRCRLSTTVRVTAEKVQHPVVVAGEPSVTSNY